MISIVSVRIRRHSVLLGALALGLGLILSGCSSNEERLDRFMERGQAYEENKEFEEAIIEFKNVLQLDPNHAAAHEALSLAYIETNQPREAYWEMSETVRLDPQNIEARLRYGTISAAIGDVDVAREQANAILEMDSDRAPAYLLRAQARESKEDYDGAEADFLAAIERRPNGPAYQFLYGGFLERRSRNDEAIEVFRKLVDYEASYMALSNLARLVASSLSDDDRSNDAEAESLLRRTIEVAQQAPKEIVERDPLAGDDVESLIPNVVYDDAVSGAYLLLASFLFERERFEETVAALEEGIAKMPGETGLIYQLARVYSARGMKEEADALIVRATEASPDETGPQLILSAYLGQQGDLEGALAAAVAAVAIDEKSDTARLREAELRIDIGYRDDNPRQIERGAEIVDAILAESPSNPEAHFVRAKVELAGDRLDSAEQSLMTALEARPDWPQARFVLGSTLAVSGEIGRSRGELARAIELDPTLADARKLLTRVHSQLGEDEFAIEQGRAYLKLVPDDSAVRIIVGQSLIRVGRRDEAYEEVSKIPEDQRDGAANFALGRLDLAAGRLELGEQRLLKADEMTPGNPSILRTLLAIDNQRGRIDVSRERIRKASEAVPDDSELAELYAEVGLLDRDVSAAKMRFENAIDLDPRNSSAQLSLAQLERRTGDGEASINVLESAVRATPSVFELQYHLGLFYEQDGRPADAIRAYEAAIGLSDDQGRAKNNLAYLLANTPGGDLDRALELAQAAKEQRPDDPNASDTLGWVLLKRGVPSAAIGYLEEAFERFPPHPVEVRSVVGNHLAEAYEKNSEPDKAIKISREVMAGFHLLVSAAKEQGADIEEPDWARDARTRIERLSSSG